MTQKSQPGEFALFIDESGSRKPNLKDEARFFSMGGVLLERADEPLVESLIAKFKERWNIEPKTPLHGNEIRSRKKRFAWLGKLSQHEQEHFFEDLTSTIISCPVIVHACVISRSGYLKRYLDKYGENTWEMTKSAFSILIERTAKYAATRNGTVMVYYEEAGKVEDELVKHYFNDLRSAGHPFDPITASKYDPISVGELSRLLRGIEGKQKSNAILQLADLCLYPVVRSRDLTENRAFTALLKGKLLVDCHIQVGQLESLGIKYYCFDDP
jgi:hypothetical protein